ncbi:MAG TPA: VWA domain-containing protein [Pyrinomonadaceae bacterium]|nr:VWA domain-containing protein [Pyrinomonadaceae bacterium]HMP65557.1 VWA domain-containing protein [Pyrinomonadaceae bacterium]
MKLAPIIVLLTAFAASAQSGRIKTAETPAPSPSPRRTVSAPVTERPRIAEPRPSPSPVILTVDEEDVIRVDSSYVPIPVTVLAKDGRAVRNLDRDDFRLQIDGVEAEIREVTRAEVPIRMAMLFDNSGSILTARNFQIEAAVRFFERVLRPGRDQGSLFRVATSVWLEQPLTADPRELVRAIQALPPPSGATSLLDGIELAARYLAETEGVGRRVIVIVSDGDDTITDTTVERALRMAQRNNCQIFVVQTTDFENFVRTGSRIGNANVRALTAERRMKMFAEQTGGAVYMPIDRRELEDAFQRISADLSEQYILGYYPESETGHNGQFRRIEVAVAGGEGMTVRARKGYYVRRD